jgi:hypothetical protein
MLLPYSSPPPLPLPRLLILLKPAQYPCLSLGHSSNHPSDSPASQCCLGSPVVLVVPVVGTVPMLLEAPGCWLLCFVVCMSPPGLGHLCIVSSLPPLGLPLLLILHNLYTTPAPMPGRTHAWFTVLTTCESVPPVHAAFQTDHSTSHPWSLCFKHIVTLPTTSPTLSTPPPLHATTSQALVTPFPNLGHSSGPYPPQ